MVVVVVAVVGVVVVEVGVGGVMNCMAIDDDAGDAAVADAVDAAVGGVVVVVVAPLTQNSIGRQLTRGVPTISTDFLVLAPAPVLSTLILLEKEPLAGTVSASLREPWEGGGVASSGGWGSGGGNERVWAEV